MKKYSVLKPDSSYLHTSSIQKRAIYIIDVFFVLLQTKPNFEENYE